MSSSSRLTGGLSILLAGILAAFAFGALRVTASQSTHLPATAASARPVPAFKHIFVIVMENKDYARVIGSDQAPYMSALAQRYGVATNYYGIRHPSLPNYLAMTGGDTFGITSDCTDCFVNQPNLVDQLEAGGKSWKAYMEDMPSPCFVGDAAPLYKQKHNPFIYYDNIRTSAARCKKIVPFTEFAADIKANTLPDFVWITPNMCNDMHDCPVSAGDSWLKTVVPQILASPAWKDQGVLFITFDEGSGTGGCCGNAAGGRLATLVLSPLGRSGFTSDVPYSHYSLLRTIEAAWTLSLLGQANCDCALPMADFFTPLAATTP
jgi:acid phosphatase